MIQMRNGESRRKLAPAKDWRNRDIDDWNTTTFTSYMADKHREEFGCEYVPMRNWGFEQGQIGRLIGTKTKEGTTSKVVVKRFIDGAFAEYKPTKDWPGTSFGFIYSYRRNILQRVQAEEAEKVRREERMTEVENVSYDDLSDWL